MFASLLEAMVLLYSNLYCLTIVPKWVLTLHCLKVFLQASFNNVLYVILKSVKHIKKLWFLTKSSHFYVELKFCKRETFCTFHAFC